MHLFQLCVGFIYLALFIYLQLFIYNYLFIVYN